jgi:hypothetical protein
MSQLICSFHNTQLTENYFDNKKKTITEMTIFQRIFKNYIAKKFTH